MIAHIVEWREVRPGGLLSPTLYRGIRITTEELKTILIAELSHGLRAFKIRDPDKISYTKKEVAIDMKELYFLEAIIEAVKADEEFQTWDKVFYKLISQNPAD